MKFVKFAVLLLFVSAATCLMAQKPVGQDGHDLEKRLEKKLEKLTSQLNLSEEQVAQIRAFEEANIVEKQAKRTAKHAEHDEARATFLEDMRPILTEEQMSILEAHAEKHGKKGGKKAEPEEGDAGKAKRKGNGKGHKQHPPKDVEKQLEKLTSLLDLSEEQITPVRSVLLKMQKKRLAEKAEHQSLRAEMHEKRLEAYEKILNEEQMAKFKEMVAEKKEKRDKKEER